MCASPQYLTYSPWQGQLNNTRMCFETALVFAWLSHRILVLPAEYRREHEPEVDHGRFRPLHPAECYTIEKLNGTVEMISQEEYRRRVGREATDRFDLTIPPETTVFCFPRIPAPGSPEAARLRDFAASRERFLEFTPQMTASRTLHLAGGTLDHFYCLFFFTQPEIEADCKRLVKDCVRFRKPIVDAAAGIAKSLGSHNALHVRRNDFFLLYPEQNISCHRLLGNVMMRIPTGTRLYVATDETDRHFFADLAAYYDLCFIDDFRRELGEELPVGATACVEQMVCASAGTFMGTRLSTFSAYIGRLRGYEGAPDQRLHFTDGSPGSEMDDEGSPPFSWINWSRNGYPLWGREFREGWQ
jgi:hypothetical protein